MRQFTDLLVVPSYSNTYFNANWISRILVAVPVMVPRAALGKLALGKERLVRMVGEVERLEAKLQVLAFFRSEFLGHREIPAQQTRAGEGISSEIAEGIGRW